MTDLQYPIGPFTVVVDPTADQIRAWIDSIAALPNQLRQAVASLGDGALDRPYRPGGWTGRQVVHHVADSHMNSYVRFRLALTEDNPTIKPYAENLWAELPDAKSGPAEMSLLVLDAVHARWVALLRTLTADQLQRTYLHPESGTCDLATAIQMYDWHGQHHRAHLGLIR